jgi:hypothetical protein
MSGEGNGIHPVEVVLEPEVYCVKLKAVGISLRLSPSIVVICAPIQLQLSRLSASTRMSLNFDRSDFLRVSRYF